VALRSLNFSAAFLSLFSLSSLLEFIFAWQRFYTAYSAKYRFSTFFASRLAQIDYLAVKFYCEPGVLPSRALTYRGPPKAPVFIKESPSVPFLAVQRL